MGTSATTLRRFNCRAARRTLMCLCAIAVAGGCSRTHYRSQADADSYSIIEEKASGRSWQPPSGFDVQPGAESRLFDPSPTDDPLLPDPRPQLYTYKIPERIGTRSLSTPPDVPPASDESNIETVAYTEVSQSGWQPSGFRLAQAVAKPISSEPPEIEVSPNIIPGDAWNSVPLSCRIRMFEFHSVRDVYQESFEEAPPAKARDDAPRLDFEDIVELALLNSRDYQTQKERLYRASLALTGERFDYDLKFAPGNGRNRISSVFSNTRAGAAGARVLSVPGNVEADQLLATGSDLLARFANRVVLTFNGPDGFAADVGSEMLFRITHFVFQTDIRFESLTRAERNVIYRARDFTRFRRDFYADLAAEYYRLLRTYRQLEIDSHNYFSLIRVFNQRLTEYDLRQISRVQVDQVEQNALGGRSSVISTCNTLETRLDDLKLLIGMPTETWINLDLRELEAITLRNEIAVALQLVRRIRERLVSERNRDELDQTELLHLAIELVSRMSKTIDLQQPGKDESPESTSLPVFQVRLRVDEALVQARRFRLELQKADNDESASTLSRIVKGLRFVRSVTRLLEHYELYAERTGKERAQIDALKQRRDALIDSHRRLTNEVEVAVDEVQPDNVDAALPKVITVVEEAEAAVRAAAELVPDGDQQIADAAEIDKTLQQIDRLLARSETLLDAGQGGLTPIDVPMDEAMLIALVRRYDLANERGFLADDWRQIKLAADELKSVLRLQAQQTIGTEASANRGFDFTFDESQTQLSVQLDTPLNRRLQRNSFRNRLIDYQAGRRQMMLVEDRIKRDIRNDIRSLRLSEEQYALGIASAALANERVISTRLRLSLSLPGINVRDFLEAQTAYAASLSAVADRHINYILGRIQLFADMELLILDDNGLWPHLRNESVQPSADELTDDWTAPYGTLPDRVEYSDEVRRMLETR